MQTAYEIRIRGRLSGEPKSLTTLSGDEVTHAFEDFTAAVKPAETVMRGDLRDQAELHGILERIRALGLELIEVRRIGDTAAGR